MDVESIAHQGHLVGLGVPVSKKMRDLVRPVHRGALCRAVERPPTRQRLGAQKHVGRPAPFVFVTYRWGLPGWVGNGGRVSLSSCTGFTSMVTSRLCGA